MRTVTHDLLLSEAVSELSVRRDGLIFRVLGWTAEEMRDEAASPTGAERIAAHSGATPEAVALRMLTIADGIDAVTTEGLSVADCCDELGLEIVSCIWELLGGDR